VANIRNTNQLYPFSGILFSKKEIIPNREDYDIFLASFALICSEMGTFAVSKRAKNKWEVL